ncbi:MAG: mobile mystery protein A, partial [Alphaproteobacteria bacterium]|nr:mobile mystery protein A [Alphaproteobacteria bacterium]
MKDAIRHLDQRFKALRPLLAVPRPPKGWVRAVRDALGMTTKQLAQRMGVAQPRITELEKAEMSGGITLTSLERAAEALGCRVVYAFVPERTLAERVEEQAERIADRQLAH